MKKFVYLLITILLTGVSATSVLAQTRELPVRAQQARNQLTVRSNESTRSGSPEDVKAELTERRKENVERIAAQREEIIQKRQEVQERVEERRENQIAQLAQNHSARLTRRFGFYYLRLSGLIDKIQFRLDAFAAAGRDVSEAQKTLNQASQMLEEANQAAQKAIAEFESLAATEESVGDLSRQAAKLAQEAQADFVDVVLQLRLVIRQVNQGAESTNESTEADASSN